MIHGKNHKLYFVKDVWITLAYLTFYVKSCILSYAKHIKKNSLLSCSSRSSSSFFSNKIPITEFVGLFIQSNNISSFTP